MATLDWLFELAGVAEQYQIIGGLRDRKHVGQRHLCRLVDEQDIETASRVKPRPEPGGRAAKLQIALQRAEKLRITGGDPDTRPIWFLICNLLHATNKLPVPACSDNGFVEKLADNGVAVRRNANCLTVLCQCGDHTRARVGLTGARRALNRKHAHVEMKRDTERGVLGKFASLLEGLATKPWCNRHEEIPRRTIVAVTLNAMLGDAFTYTQERIGKDLGFYETMSEDCLRV